MLVQTNIGAETDEAARLMNKPKLFIPLSHNGCGMGPINVVPLFMAAFEGYEIDMRVCGDSHANRAMNRVAADFLYSDCDELIIVDIDVTFTRRHIQRLLSHDVPLVYGIYPKKDEKTEPCLCTFKEIKTRDDGLIEVRRCGRGFLRAKREVFEAMKEDNGGPALRFHNHGRVEWDFFPSGPVCGLDVSVYDIGDKDEDGFQKREWLSEDWYFCDRARALGYPTLVDPNIALGHIGPKEYRFREDQLGKAS
jgi:hypothetical protein